MPQVSLVWLVQKKQLIAHLYGYSDISFYHKILRFKVLSTADSIKKQESFRLEKEYGLIQGVSDRFDATFLAQNELKQTHLLANIINQNSRIP